ncbi:DUF2244 domain-containing protein [Massilia sp. 9096]|uniref:DUF2244 domain-containing protein n=1 Tax=Massilia sp. 9096 TaxID=1500894 RepID=UPI00068E107A|nr:DUF2244 domain-containing protein [Massilia sp. 9096]
MTREWTLQRNCSLAPRQVALAYAMLCAFSLTVGLALLVLHGIWVVLAFSLLELALVGLALIVYARHALDREHILLADTCLLVECVQADRCRQARLDPLWTRVLAPDERRRPLIRLESRGDQVEIGRFVSEARRCQVERELRQALRGRSAMQ